MLQTNVNNFSYGKSHLALNVETKIYDIREEIKNNARRIIPVQSKFSKGHAENLKEMFNRELWEDNAAKLSQKYKKVSSD